MIIFVFNNTSEKYVCTFNELKDGDHGVSSGPQAGLASMETLDDSNGSFKHDDGMENVRLDNVEV